MRLEPRHPTAPGETVLTLERVGAAIVRDVAARPPRRRDAVLFLGSDREIGRASRSLEKRVGVTPDQVAALIAMFRQASLNLSVLVLRGAGQRAGHPDSAYIAAGAEIVDREELPYLDGPPDVVHALKEPSTYEAEIPGPFARIGALHSGDFDRESGLARLVVRGQVAVFDGSAIGAPSAYRIPIRGRMSRYAGEVGAEWIRAHLEARELEGRIVIVGAGNAGRAAARVLLASSRVLELAIFDAAADAARLDSIKAAYADEPRAHVAACQGIDDPALVGALTGAVATLFAVARPRAEAPKVVQISTLGRVLAEQAMVVDISIDERGAIADPTIGKGWSSKRIIPHLERALARRGQRVYRALANMPRAYPGKASDAHGEVILPYLATLLYLSAKHGGADAAARAIAELPIDPLAVDPATARVSRLLAALTLDLRNGLACHDDGQRLIVEDVIADRAGLFALLVDRERPFVFSNRPELGSPERATLAYEGLPIPVAETLTQAAHQGIWVRGHSHPQIDGTTTDGAMRALAVEAARIIKCLIFRQEDGRHVAVLAPGDKRVREELVAAACGQSVRLASREEVMQVTGHGVGSEPVLELFDRLAGVLISDRLLEAKTVFGSAGTELFGIEIDPRDLVARGARVVSITPPDALVRRNARAVEKELARIHAAIRSDDDQAARVAIERLRALTQTDEGAR